MPLRNVKRFSSKVLRQPGYALQVAKRRSKAYFAYYAHRPRAPLPEAVTIFLTHRCNLRCKMCGQWGEHGITKDQAVQNIARDMTLEELKKVVDDIAAFKPHISLFGGEPLLHRHAMDIIRYIKNNGLHCLMITNGAMLPEVYEELVESGIDELNVSLDGGRELHDTIRGMAGLFDRTRTGLKEIAKLKHREQKSKPLVNLQCTISRHNYQHLDQMLDIAQEVQADSMTFHNLIFVSREMMEQQQAFDRLLNCSSADWEGFMFEPGIDPHDLYVTRNNIMNTCSRIPVDFYPHFTLAELKEYYSVSSVRPQKSSVRCVSPWMTAYIFPDGELRPCLNVDYSFGNIKSHLFSRIWNSERAATYRKTLRKNRIFPACLRCTELYRY